MKRSFLRFSTPDASLIMAVFFLGLFGIEMNYSLLVAYMLAILLLLMTPGPVVALVTATAARDGARQAFLTLLGTNAASLVLMALAILMLIGVVSVSPFFLTLLGLSGSLYIGWSAIGGLRRLGESRVVTPSRGGVVQGFLIGISNPKDILFFSAFFPQFVAVTHHFTLSMLTLSLVWMLFDLGVLSLYILTVRCLPRGRYSRRLECLSSLFLLGVALFGIAYNLGEMSAHYH